MCNTALSSDKTNRSGQESTSKVFSKNKYLIFKFSLVFCRSNFWSQMENRHRTLKINLFTENFSHGIKCLLFELPKKRKARNSHITSCLKGEFNIFIIMTQRMQYSCFKNNRVIEMAGNSKLQLLRNVEQTEYPRHGKFQLRKVKVL